MLVVTFSSELLLMSSWVSKSILGAATQPSGVPTRGFYPTTSVMLIVSDDLVRDGDILARSANHPYRTLRSLFCQSLKFGIYRRRVMQSFEIWLLLMNLLDTYRDMSRQLCDCGQI